MDAGRLRTGRLHEPDWPKISHAVGRLGEANIFIDDNPHLTVMEIRAKARRLKSRHGELGHGRASKRASDRATAPNTPPCIVTILMAAR